MAENVPHTEKNNYVLALDGGQCHSQKISTDYAQAFKAVIRLSKAVVGARLSHKQDLHLLTNINKNVPDLIRFGNFRRDAEVLSADVLSTSSSTSESAWTAADVTATTSCVANYEQWAQHFSFINIQPSLLAG